MERNQKRVLGNNPLGNRMLRPEKIRKLLFVCYFSLLEISRPALLSHTHTYTLTTRWRRVSRFFLFLGNIFFLVVVLPMEDDDLVGFSS